MWDECTLTELRNGSVLMSARIDDPHNTDYHHPDTNMTRVRTSRGFARSDDGGATWAEKWTLYDRQPEIPDQPCSDPLIYSHKTGAMYFGHPGEWFGPGPWTRTRSNYTILRSLDEGASWSFLDVVWPGGAGYSDMHLLPSGDDEPGDLIGVAFQKATTWPKPRPGMRNYINNMGWATVWVPPPIHQVTRE